MPQYNFVSPGAMAAKSIEEFLLKQALMQRQQEQDSIAEQERQAQAKRQADEMNFRREQAGANAMNDAADRHLRQREFDLRARMIEAQEAERARAAQAEASQAANTRGMRQMMADAVNQGPLTPQRAQSISMMGFREGVQAPGIVDRAMTPRPPVELNEGTVLVNPETGGVIARGNPRREPAGPQSPVAVIDPATGRPVYVRPADAIGRTPASNREQGRPVISGDANRIADLDTSLNDLDVLERETSGMTGTGSAIGAALPNAITDLTGWGADSKARQAVIDRVKQVIGKALEGGVLRKEDEVKYAKILPVIGDEASVAASKIKGLRQAIEQRRGTTLDALGDAGYDVARYRERGHTDERVTVISPQGQRGTIPASQLEQALAQGYKRAQ